MPSPRGVRRTVCTTLAGLAFALTATSCGVDPPVASPPPVGVSGPTATDPRAEADVQLTLASSDADAVERIARRVRTYLAELPPDTTVNVVAIGSDRTTGDALGPFVGEFLRSSRRYRVIGTLQDPVTALNLPQRIAGLDGFTIAVDAALGGPVGDVTVRRGALDPGQALGNTLPPVGDVAVSGLVAVPGTDAFEQLRSAALGEVRALARVIAQGLATAVDEEIDVTVPG
jgi:putative sporulation protein YyaC